MTSEIELVLAATSTVTTLIEKIKDFFSKRKDPYKIEKTFSFCCSDCIPVLEQIRRKEVTHETAEILVNFKGNGNAQSIQLCYLIPIVYLRINERYSAIQHAKYFEKLVESNFPLSQLAGKLRANIESLS